MALNWKTVTADHVRKACVIVASTGPKTKLSGIIVWNNDLALPAKEVLRVAYRIAHGLDDSQPVKFSSGDGTINLLQQLGYVAERRDRI